MRTPGEDCHLSIIIPAYNEERRLPSCFLKIDDFLKSRKLNCEILVVTDGSSDKTADITRAQAKKNPAVRLIQFANNRGKGFAVREGMLAARGKYRLFMDVDCAVEVDFIDSFLDCMEAGTDIVIASRALKQSVVYGGHSFLRRQMTAAFAALQALVLRMPIKDTQCGFKLFSCEAAVHLFSLSTLDCAYFDAEVLFLARKLGYKITQVPVVWTHDADTRLPIGLRRSVDLLVKLLRIPVVHRDFVK